MTTATATQYDFLKLPVNKHESGYTKLSAIARCEHLSSMKKVGDIKMTKVIGSDDEYYVTYTKY